MAKGVTVDLIVDPKGAIKGLDAASKSAGKTTQVLGGLGRIGVGALVGLGTAALGVVTGLTAATKSAGKYAETVELAASRTHLTTDAVQELQYASKITGVEFETISGSLTKLTKAQGAAAAGGKKQQEAFAALGVSATDANGQLRLSTDVYADVLTALGKIDNPTQRDVLAMTLLGKSATQLNPLIDGTAGSMSELAKQAHAAGAVLDADTIAKLAKADDAFDSLRAGVDAAKNALGLTLMPIITQLGTQGTGLLGEFTNAVLAADGDLGKAAPKIGEVFGKAGQLLLEQIPVFLQVGTSVVSSIISGIATQAPALISAAVPVLVGFVETLLDQLPSLVLAGAQVLIALVTGIADALPELIPAAVQTIVSIVNILITQLPLILNAGLQLLKGLAEGIITALPILIAALPKIIVGLVTFLVNAIPTIIQTGVTLLTSLVTALPDIISGIADAVPQIILGLVTALNDPASVSALVTAGVALITALVNPEAMVKINLALIKAVPTIVNSLAKGFADPKLQKQMAQAGVELIGGLWKGIQSQGDWLWKQISGFFGKQIDQIKGLLGIHSPSTVFAGFGKNLVQGLAVGIRSNAGLVSGAMDDLSAQAVGLSAQASLAVDARAAVTSGSGFGGGGTVIQVTLPPTGSVFATPDQYVKQAVAAFRDAVRNGTIPADWSVTA